VTEQLRRPWAVVTWTRTPGPGAAGNRVTHGAAIFPSADAAAVWIREQYAAGRMSGVRFDVVNGDPRRACAGPADFDLAADTVTADSRILG
jgi:hypothetical protein